jgi:hypothetical protein
MRAALRRKAVEALPTKFRFTGFRAMEKNHDPAAPVPAPNSTLLEVTGRRFDLPALAAALAGIRADSQRDPEIYLQDTVVPSGGE